MNKLKPIKVKKVYLKPLTMDKLILTPYVGDTANKYYKP